MQTAGYVLAGGASSRMGTNKALLTLGGRTLIEIAVAAVGEAAGSVTIVGPADVFSGLGFPVIPDLRSNAGPLAGIETALSHSAADWNLIVACDMPRVSRQTLRHILDEALAHPDVLCVLPESNAGRREPLCAAYQRRALSVISNALNQGTRKVSDALQGSPVRYLPMTNDPIFQNINTPEDWREYRTALQP